MTRAERSITPFYSGTGARGDRSAIPLRFFFYLRLHSQRVEQVEAVDFL